MSDYNEAWSALSDALGGSAADPAEGLTVDQKLKVAEVKALLSIAQELSSLNPQNTSHYGQDGTEYNGWGLPVPR